jgi:hypothetical protein
MPTPANRVIARLSPAEVGPSPPRRRKKPLHEQIGWLGRLRGVARRKLFGFLGRLASTDDARGMQVSALRNLLSRKPALRGLPVEAQPYADLSRTEPRGRASDQEDVVLITGRFRSGSTLLWNLFRNLEGCTAYYEPFNERRWFDPAARGSHTDPTHRKVEDYWREYEGMEALGKYYQESWIERDLFMDEESWDPAMKRYVETLIERAPGRPVLQFNRIDFRLPWFRHHFPRAKVIHLYRHPRDQWCSSLVKPSDCPRQLSPAEFARHDHYYLLGWCRDLKYYFPFLDERLVEHPYQLFYYLWKLSYLFGRRYAHHSVAFEDLVEQPVASLASLLRAVGVEGADLNRLRQLIEKPKAGKWREYADEAWFRQQEAACEGVLADFFRRGPEGAEPAAAGEPELATA